MQIDTSRLYDIDGPNPPDSRYDYTHASQQNSSMFIRDSGWKPTPDQTMKINQALWANSPSTPMDDLRGHAPFNVVAIPATPGQPTIEDILGTGAGSAPVMQTFSDYSGTNGGYEGSSRNNISVADTG